MTTSIPVKISTRDSWGPVKLATTTRTPRCRSDLFASELTDDSLDRAVIS